MMLFMSPWSFRMVAHCSSEGMDSPAGQNCWESADCWALARPFAMQLAKYSAAPKI